MSNTVGNLCIDTKKLRGTSSDKNKDHSTYTNNRKKNSESSERQVNSTVVRKTNNLVGVKKPNVDDTVHLVYTGSEAPSKPSNKRFTLNSEIKKRKPPLNPNSNYNLPSGVIPDVENFIGQSSAGLSFPKVTCKS